MLRTLTLCALLCSACGSTPKQVTAPPKADCRPGVERKAKVETRYDVKRNATVVHITNKHHPYCGEDTALIVAASYEGREVGVAPEELTMGLAVRGKAFRLVGCSRLVLEDERGAKTPMLAERVPEIGAGALKEYLLGPIPLQTFLRLFEARELKVRACDVVHEVRPDEQAAVSDLLRALGAR